MELGIFKIVALVTVAFLAVSIMLPRFRRLAIKHGFVDKPGGRKDHENLVPPIGGLVIFPIFLILSLATDTHGIKHYLNEYWPLLSSLLLILITGAIDDRFDIRASIKFFIQFLAALIIVGLGDIKIESLGNLVGLGTLNFGWATIPFTVFCVMLLINAMNMIDGIDGLAGGKSLIALLWISIACGLSGKVPSHEIIVMVLLIGTIGGFLYSNMRSPVCNKAKIFLGDSGAMALGLALSWFCIKYSQEPYHIYYPITVAWILALPVIDNFALFTVRLSLHEHPFSADRRHLHHHFIDAGISPGRSTSILLATSCITGLIGYGGTRLDVPEYILTFSWVLLLAIHTYLKFHPEIFISFLSRFADKENK